MFRIILATTALAGLVACGDGNPFDGDILAEEGTDVSPNNVYLDDETNDGLTANNVEYDAVNDQVIINNIPFDDPQNRYDRIAGENFAGSFDAYQSAPTPGTNEEQYFAVFRRTTFSQVAAVGTAGYLDFGYAGAGAQRVNPNTVLPTAGIFSYNGEYAAVQTTLDPLGNSINYIIGDAILRVDYDDFDGIGAVGGTINNRYVYDATGNNPVFLPGFISFTDTNIDFDTNTIELGEATRIDGAGDEQGSGNWAGTITGPNGEEIAGVVYVEDGTIQEVGVFIANR